MVAGAGHRPRPGTVCTDGQGGFGEPKNPGRDVAVGPAWRHRCLLRRFDSGVGHDKKSTPWVTERKRTAPIAARFGYQCNVRNPDNMAALSGGPDDAPGELGEKGFGATFPHRLRDTENSADAIFATPLGNELVSEAAKAAVVAEQLGAAQVPGYLVVGFSAHDYAAHGWGHESLEAWDILLRLDTTLAEFKKYLGAKVGEGQGSLFVTSDHSAAPLLERRIAAGLAGQRDASQRIAAAAQAAASVGLGWAKARTWRTRGIQRSLFRARCWLNQRKNERLRYRRCALLVHSCLASRLRHSPPRLRAFVKPVWMHRWRFVWRSIRCGRAKLYFCRQKGMVLHENDEAVATHPGSPVVQLPGASDCRRTTAGNCGCGGTTAVTCGCGDTAANTTKMSWFGDFAATRYRRKAVKITLMLTKNCSQY